MLLRESVLVAPSSHISRKNAIIAVIMSASAIFHAPPCAPPCPPGTFLKIIGAAGALSSPSFAGSLMG
jgi:hypothetical protein